MMEGKPTKQQLYGDLPSISKTIQIRQTRQVGHCWRSKDELISHVLQWTSSPRRDSVERPTRIYLQQLCTNTGCCLEDLQEEMDDRDEWEERECVWKYDSTMVIVVEDETGDQSLNTRRDCLHIIFH